MQSVSLFKNPRRVIKSVKAIKSHEGLEVVEMTQLSCLAAKSLEKCVSCPFTHAVLVFICIQPKNNHNFTRKTSIIEGGEFVQTNGNLVNYEDGSKRCTYEVINYV